ncbi:hypothetical protein CVT25_009292 [Psilocybe cyanescens]|uniref:Retrotransposon gag domain-containing protein n=1 Tax=Psilocybe cyanescens TaxID=93625 RepID=A0A409XDU2_PSICY|nr:hypothetical protein CVT25_009292 [Psilocybe cyanescens]
MAPPKSGIPTTDSSEEGTPTWNWQTPNLSRQSSEDINLNNEDLSNSLFDLLSTLVIDQEEQQDTDIVKTTNGKKEIMINKPTVFNGDRTKSKSFIQDCYLYMDINDNIYNTDEKKIAFILLFCTEAEVKLWKEQYMTSRTRGTSPNQTIDWDTLATFLEKFHNAFTPVDKTRSAINDIKQLRQKPNERVEVVINRFKLLVGQANLGSESESDHAHLIGLFQRTIQGWYKKVTQFDTNWRLAKIFKEQTEE